MFAGFGTYFGAARKYIDNTTFRLHYKITFGLIVLCSTLVTSYQFLGRPITCMTDAPAPSAVDTYCWIHGTFTVFDHINKTVGNEVVQPGVGPKLKDGNHIRHSYYQWVAMVLVLQAIMCYIPHYLWKFFEGEKLAMLIQDLDEETIQMKDTKAKRRKISNYMKHMLGTHNSYAYKFLMCEFLNLVNIVGQMFLMDKFLGGQFSSYGRDVIWTAEQGVFQHRIDPLNQVFPKMTKCDFYMYGPSGGIQLYDSLCLLPLNIINEKIYVFLWFWYIFVAVFTAVHLTVELLTLVSSYFRATYLSYYAKQISMNDIKSLVKKCDYGDWFILKQLGKFILPDIYNSLLEDLRLRLDEKFSDNIEDDE